MFTWANGDVYEGTFSEDKIQGEGKITFKTTGDVFEGTFKNGKKHGDGGCLVKKNGTKYKGDFEENLRHGEGEFWFCNENGELQYYYSGPWVNGKRDTGSNKKGILIFA